MIFNIQGGDSSKNLLRNCPPHRCRGEQGSHRRAAAEAQPWLRGRPQRPHRPQLCSPSSGWLWLPRDLQGPDRCWRGRLLDKRAADDRNPPCGKEPIWTGLETSPHAQLQHQHWSGQRPGQPLIFFQPGHLLSQDANGRTPLFVCTASKGPGATDCMKTLLEFGAEVWLPLFLQMKGFFWKVDVQNSDGYTALHMAAIDRKPARVNLLISRWHIGELDENLSNANYKNWLQKFFYDNSKQSKMLVKSSFIFFLWDI